MPSAEAHPDVIDKYIGEELAGGRILGPFPPGSIGGLHTNRMGVVPKGHTPGKWRLITDLSYPPGGSVNDGVDPRLCSLQYTTVEKVAAAAQRLGPGALLAELDIRSAYRLVPVHPDDRPLLGITWRGEVFVDGMLPFGLRSAPKIFTAVADALEWILRQCGVVAVDHYLDDFIMLGPPDSPICGVSLDIILLTCSELGVPLAMDKLDGPTSRITFLGIEIDTRAGILRLPEDKLRRIIHALDRWTNRRACERRELESLIGLLQHACKVVRPGRSFLRRMIDLLRVPRQPRHHVRLNLPFRADLQWWATFVSQWNGVAILPAALPPVREVTSDASGCWGCGAWSGDGWFQYRWPESAAELHISFKELFAVLLEATQQVHEGRVAA